MDGSKAQDLESAIIEWLEMPDDQFEKTIERQWTSGELSVTLLTDGRLVIHDHAQFQFTIMQVERIIGDAFKE